MGTSKVGTLKKRLQQITPWVHFDLCNELFGASAAHRLLGPWEGRKPDFVIDAIDNIDSKVELLEYCYKNEDANLIRQESLLETFLLALKIHSRAQLAVV